MFLALQEKTVWRNGMIVADSCMMKRLGIVCPLDSKPGSSLQRAHCTATNYYLLNTTENNIDYARPCEPMDLDADDVVGALQKKDLCGIGVWRFDDSC